MTPDSQVTSVPKHGLFSRHPAEPAAAQGLPPVHGYAGRLSADVLAKTAFPPELHPAVYACGPSGFVEAASDLLVAAGFPATSIKTERFGPN